MTEKRHGDGEGPSLNGLLALNAALVALLAAVTFGPKVAAQARPRGEYTMVAGGVKGAEGSAVFIVDTVNQEMMTITYSQQGKVLEGIAYRSLAADAASVQRPRTRPGN